MKEITLGNKKYPIRFTMFVLAQVEKETDHKNILTEINEWGLYDAIVMIFYGCRKADPSFSFSMEEIGDLLEMDSIMEVFQAFTSDMAASAAGKK